MRTFLDLLGRYLPLALPALVLGVIAYIAVTLIFRRRGRPLSRAWKLWCFFTAVYVFALLCVLILRSGEPRYESWYNLELFYGYRMLMADFTSHAFLNEFMNILIFVPCGFLFALPFGERKSRWLVIPLGFLTSLTVEVLQYLLASGIADVDDLFNNTLGTVCGFALARFCLNVRGKRAARSAVSLVLALVCLSPPLAAWALWSASPYGTSEFDVRQGTPLTGGISFSEDAAAFLSGLTAEELGVYATSGGDLAAARECADRFYAVFGQTRDTEDLYDESAWFRSADGQLSVVYRYAGPEIEYTNYNVYSSRVEYMGSDPGLSEEEIRALVLGWGLEIPEGGAFSDEDGAYVFSYDAGTGLGGEISAEVLEGELARVDWHAYETERIGYAEPISAEECVRRLARGDFSWREMPEGDVHIENADVVYTLDSKGAYRPLLELSADGARFYLSLAME